MRFFLFILLINILFSCSTKKNILYLQDVNVNSTFEFDYSQYKIKVDDILKIDVYSDIPELTASCTKKINPTNLPNRESLKFEGYQVSPEGFINFPSLGKIFVLDMTINELRLHLTNMITDKGFLIDPMIDIKFLNSSFTILGEVSKPGRYEYLSNNLNIFQAIGYAGDLTINGVRDDIKIIREDSKGIKSINSVDLTSVSVMKNDLFHIMPGDIIIVKPNTSRVKNAGIIGNSGTLLSLLSFLLSSIIIINSN